MNLTLVGLAHRIDDWQQRLESLGISHWRLNVAIVNEVDGLPGSAAAVRFGGSYDTADVFFARKFVTESSAKQIDEAIIHELLHIAMRDYDNVIGFAEEWMPPQTYAVHDLNVRQQREALVERLARTIYARSKR